MRHYEIGVRLEFHRTPWLLSGNRLISQLLESSTVPLFAFYNMRARRDSEELFAGADGVLVVPREHALEGGKLAREIYLGDEQSRARLYEKIGIKRDGL